jgi:hypothetical protein
VQRALRASAALLGIRIERWSGFRFRTDAEAVRYAIEHPRDFRREPAQELRALQAVTVE